MAKIENISELSVGTRVRNRHYQSCDYSAEYRASYNGTVTKIEYGCNPVVWVKFDGLEFETCLPLQDLELIK